MLAQTLICIFTYIGIYTTISTIWKAYELKKYKEVRPNGRDALIDVLLTTIIYGILFLWNKYNDLRDLFCSCYLIYKKGHYHAKNCQ